MQPNRQEQAELLRKWQAGDREAGNRLADSAYPWAVTVAFKYGIKRGLDKSDCEEIANIGLWNAMLRWNPGRGSLTMAVYFGVRQQVNYEALTMRSAVRVPALTAKDPRMAEQREFAHRLPLSLKKPLPGKADRLREPTLRDRLPGADGPQLERLVAEEEVGIELAELRRGLGRLRDSYREVLEAYFLEGKTLEEVGAERGVTRKRIRQLKDKGLRELRAILRRERLRF
jgi:RNA polymerase sigma factor (sigma-70 family)